MLLQQGVRQLIFYGDLLYKFKKILGKPNLSEMFRMALYYMYIHLTCVLDILAVARKPEVNFRLFIYYKTLKKKVTLQILNILVVG